MTYCIYQITNTVNGKIYIGAHRTTNPNDDYMGSGRAIKAAIAKYGKDKFTKTILSEWTTEDEMYDEEARLVTSEFLLRRDVYNLVVGGGRGGGICKNEEQRRQKLSEAAKRQWSDPEYRKRQTAVLQSLRDDNAERMKARNAEQWNNPTFREKMQETRRTYRPTEETKAKTAKALTGRPASENVKRSMSHVGASNRGSVWVKHTERQECKKTTPDQLPALLADGWTLGRIGWKNA